MRREDREVKDIDQLEAIIRQCVVCHVAFHGGDYPYLIPLNFGYTRIGGAFTLYFHGAKEGEKYHWLQKDARVSFQMECNLRLHTKNNGCSFTMAYESVAGNGLMAIVDDMDKHTALEAIMRQYAPDQTFSFSAAALDIITLLRIDVHTMTGKRLTVP